MKTILEFINKGHIKSTSAPRNIYRDGPHSKYFGAQIFNDKDYADLARALGKEINQYAGRSINSTAKEEPNKIMLGIYDEHDDKLTWTSMLNTYADRYNLLVKKNVTYEEFARLVKNNELM